MGDFKAWAPPDLPPVLADQERIEQARNDLAKAKGGAPGAIIDLHNN